MATCSHGQSQERDRNEVVHGVVETSPGNAHHLQNGQRITSRKKNVTRHVHCNYLGMQGEGIAARASADTRDRHLHVTLTRMVVRHRVDEGGCTGLDGLALDCIDVVEGVVGVMIGTAYLQEDILEGGDVDTEVARHTY